MSLKAFEGGTFVEAVPEEAWFLDAADGEVQVVWEPNPAAPGWEQVWPDPEPVRSISVEFAQIGGHTGISQIGWARVPFDIQFPPGHVHNKGDLIVGYTVRFWWNAVKGDLLPVSPDPDVPQTWTAPGATAMEFTALTFDNKWVFPAIADVGNEKYFEIDVKAHYLFHDGTNPVEQPIPVSRESFFKGETPNTPLPAPATVLMDWITDTGIGKGSEVGLGHFRNAATIGAATGAPPGRPTVQPDVEYIFAAVGASPAATLPTPTRMVTETLATAAGDPGRPAVAAITETVYDYSPQDAQPALTGSSRRVRRYVDSVIYNMTKAAFGPQTATPGPAVVIPPGQLGAVGPPKPTTSGAATLPTVDFHDLGPAIIQALDPDPTATSFPVTITGLASLKADPIYGTAAMVSFGFSAASEEDDYILLNDGVTKVIWDGSDWAPFVPRPTITGPPTPTGFVGLDKDMHVTSMDYDFRISGAANPTDPVVLLPGHRMLELHVTNADGTPGLHDGMRFAYDRLDNARSHGTLVMDQYGGTISITPLGDGWGGPNADPHLDVILSITGQTLKSQVGTARVQPLPWDGVPGSPGDPGTPATVRAGTRTQTYAQGGKAHALAWDNVPGHPGDPGAKAAGRSHGRVWSWPFNAHFEAVPGADGYEVSVGGLGWHVLAGVPASAIGPAAAGTVDMLDLWVAQLPTFFVDVKVRGFTQTGTKRAPGFATTVTDDVPRYPTIGPVLNLNMGEIGYRYATARWDPPAIELGPAAHYFSDKYRISADGVKWTTTTGNVGNTDNGDKLVPAQHDWEAIGATPGGMTRQPSGEAPDPGAPSLLPSGPSGFHARPITSWGTNGPDTNVAVTLLPKIVRWIKDVVAPARIQKIKSTSTPDVITWNSAPYNVNFGSRISGTKWEIANSWRNSWAGSWNFPGGGPGVIGRQTDMAPPYRTFPVSTPYPPGIARTPAWHISVVKSEGVSNPARVITNWPYGTQSADERPASDESSGKPGSYVMFKVTGGPPGHHIVGISGGTWSSDRHPNMAGSTEVRMWQAGQRVPNAHSTPPGLYATEPVRDFVTTPFPIHFPMPGNVYGHDRNATPEANFLAGAHEAYARGDNFCYIAVSIQNTPFRMARMIFHLEVVGPPTTTPGVTTGHPSLYFPPLIKYRAVLNPA